MEQEKAIKMLRILCVTTAAILMVVTEAASKQLEIEAAQIALIRAASGDSTGRILVQWELPSDLNTKIIDGASITISIAANAKGPFAVDVMPITRNWSASTVSWAEGWRRSGGDYADSLPASAIVDPADERMVTISVYDAILDHVNGRRNNFGFVIIPDVESKCVLAAFAANAAGKLANARLIIAYRNRR